MFVDVECEKCGNTLIQGDSSINNNNDRVTIIIFNCHFCSLENKQKESKAEIKLKNIQEALNFKD